MGQSIPNDGIHNRKNDDSPVDVGHGYTTFRHSLICFICRLVISWRLGTLPTSGYLHMMISSTVETGDFDEPKRCSELLIAQEVPPVEEIAGVREGLLDRPRCQSFCGP